MNAVNRDLVVATMESIVRDEKSAAWRRFEEGIDRAKNEPQSPQTNLLNEVSTLDLARLMAPFIAAGLNEGQALDGARRAYRAAEYELEIHRAPVHEVRWLTWPEILRLFKVKNRRAVQTWMRRAIDAKWFDPTDVVEADLKDFFVLHSAAPEVAPDCVVRRLLDFRRVWILAKNRLAKQAERNRKLHKDASRKINR